jgi:hypothetical protein
MPTLTLVHHDQTLAFTLEKIDRDRLYGYVDVQTLDGAGQPCERVTLAADGHTLAGKGDTALAYLSPDGLWRRRDQLRSVDSQHAPILPIKSTFSCPVPLDTEASIDDYLTHTIQLVYQLVPERVDLIGPFFAELAGGKIYRFSFSYRGGIDPAVAFVLAGADGHIFLCVGKPTALEYVGLEALAALSEEDEATEEEELLDFGVM